MLPSPQAQSGRCRPASSASPQPARTSRGHGHRIPAPAPYPEPRTAPRSPAGPGLRSAAAARSARASSDSSRSPRAPLHAIFALSARRPARATSPRPRGKGRAWKTRGEKAPGERGGQTPLLLGGGRQPGPLPPRRALNGGGRAGSEGTGGATGAAVGARCRRHRRGGASGQAPPGPGRGGGAAQARPRAWSGLGVPGEGRAAGQRFPAFAVRAIALGCPATRFLRASTGRYVPMNAFPKMWFCSGGCEHLEPLRREAMGTIGSLSRWWHRDRGAHPLCLGRTSVTPSITSAFSCPRSFV